MSAYLRNLVPISDNLHLVSSGGTDPAPAPWSILELTLTSAMSHAWWDVPVRVELRHEGGRALSVPGYYDGEHWRIRFCLPEPGGWTWRTSSDDPGLDGVQGELSVVTPDGSALRANPNLRGHIRADGSGRVFAYADGTPFFLLLKGNPFSNPSHPLSHRPRVGGG